MSENIRTALEADDGLLPCGCGKTPEIIQVGGPDVPNYYIVECCGLSVDAKTETAVAHFWNSHRRSSASLPQPPVHNHGPEDGPGLSCPETRSHDGRLRGACLGALPQPGGAYSGEVDGALARVEGCASHLMPRGMQMLADDGKILAAEVRRLRGVGEQQPVAWMEPETGNTISVEHMKELAGKDDWDEVFKAYTCPVYPPNASPAVSPLTSTPVCQICHGRGCIETTGGNTPCGACGPAVPPLREGP